MESNPYQAPRSEVTDGALFRRSIGWKIYFFCITGISALAMLGLFFTPDAGASEVASLAFWLVATVGLFGFAFDKPIATPRFWLIVLIVYGGFSVTYYFLTDIDLRAGLTDAQFYISNAISWAIALPGYYALYAFSRPYDPVWKKH
ncbi:hypothetical protein [Pseudomonas mangrovi]|jgi:hypothetical protein|uniref:Uncharacterized protein n=1 Tax=Pseudomonas mangrovi TaxID=2161748 RepID=A0A2T5PEB3_9PSED|nr:hypothetical protein [Pseudomonas mangrovi]PTU76076.1 hypothetical protein DBO85_00095 [Pseudomonas mangrovi]